MAESPAHFHWRNAPRSTFENFRDCALGLVDGVRRVYLHAWELTRKDIGKGLMLQFCLNPPSEIGAEMARLHSDAKEFWQTPIRRYLTEPHPLVFSKAAARGRYDGCCAHEIAMKLADGLWEAIGNNTNCDEYCEQLQSQAGTANVSDHLISLTTDITCECVRGFDRYAAGQNVAPERQSEPEMVNRQWIAYRSGIPVDTLRGPKYRPLLGEPDESEPGMPNLWKKDRALDFIAKHGKL